MDFKRQLILTSLFLLPVLFGYGSEMDSLGIKSEQDVVYVLHQVDAQETVYSLSKRYGVSVASVVENNQIVDNNLSIGSVLKIPWIHGLTHSVQEGETLYALSRQYQVPQSKIKEMNSLTSDELEVGRLLIILLQEEEIGSGGAQELTRTSNLHVVGEKETLYSISKKYDLELQDLKKWNDLTDYQVKAGDTLLLAPSGESTAMVTLPAVQEQTITVSSASEELEVESSIVDPDDNKARDVMPVKESGIAAVIDGTTDTRKYLALHPTAPVGTIMRVRNEMTNLSVFVRVVGKLPDTGANNNVLIRLSQAAQQALGALDGKFRVELSYVPNQ